MNSDNTGIVNKCYLCGKRTNPMVWETATGEWYCTEHTAPKRELAIKDRIRTIITDLKTKSDGSFNSYMKAIEDIERIVK